MTDSIVEQAMRGLAVGIMVGLIVFFVLRPREPYPRWVLTPFEQPWMLLGVALVFLLVFQWDQRVALLIFLFVLGVGLDVHIYGKTYSQPKETVDPSPDTISPPSIAEVDTIKGFGISGEPLQKVPLHTPDGFALPVPHYPLYHNDAPNAFF
jgi:hypothetical protein